MVSGEADLVRGVYARLGEPPLVSVAKRENKRPAFCGPLTCGASRTRTGDLLGAIYARSFATLANVRLLSQPAAPTSGICGMRHPAPRTATVAERRIASRCRRRWWADQQTTLNSSPGRSGETGPPTRSSCECTRKSRLGPPI